MEALVPALWCLMHTIWLTAVLRAIFAMPFTDPVALAYPLWLVPVLLLGGGWLESRVAHLRRSWLIGAIAGLVLVVAVVALVPMPEGLGALSQRWPLIYRFRDGIPSLLLAALATAAIWLMGLAADWTDEQALWRGFVTGSLMLALLALLPAGALGERAIPLGSAMALYVFSGLLALALQSLLRVLEERRRAGGRGLERYWLVSLGVVTLALIILGALVALILTPEAVGRLVAVVWPVVRVILTPVLFLFQWAGYILVWLLSKMLSGLQLTQQDGQRQQMEPSVPRSMAEQIAEIEQGARISLGLPPDLVRIVLSVAVVAVLLLLVYLVWRRRRGRRGAAAVDEDRTSILTADILVEQFQEWVASLRPRRGGLIYTDDLDASDPRESIRILYRRLLQLARRIGRPRARGQTPASFGRSLTILVPGEDQRIREVTDRYVAVRYGDHAPTAQQVQATREAVDEVERALNAREGR